MHLEMPVVFDELSGQRIGRVALRADDLASGRETPGFAEFGQPLQLFLLRAGYLL